MNNLIAVKPCYSKIIEKGTPCRNIENAVNLVEFFCQIFYLIQIIKKN